MNAYIPMQHMQIFTIPDQILTHSSFHIAIIPMIYAPFDMFVLMFTVLVDENNNPIDPQEFPKPNNAGRSRYLRPNSLFGLFDFISIMCVSHWQFIGSPICLVMHFFSIFQFAIVCVLDKCYSYVWLTLSYTNLLEPSVVPPLELACLPVTELSPDCPTVDLPRIVPSEISDNKTICKLALSLHDKETDAIKHRYVKL